ncbi:hypothetical protein D9758_012157 [Tetrapyrgos nigripes]|uniref:Uncharacterized protein n=1 Tax=Tetrapyrgos nigripes TaxID=182062 RepID=A0A8H5CFK1_9AGAR|nr:hypothetical protein D9758_012157 [Tetrapyrgos nigripes]
MSKNKDTAPVDKQLERENKRPRLPKNWPSSDHHKCSRVLCNHPNPPQSVPGTYQCSGCYKGTYVVTIPQAAKIHDEAQRVFQWHDERRKEGKKKREDAEKIAEERYIAKYLATDEEMWQRAMKLKRKEEEEKLRAGERRQHEARMAERRCQEAKMAEERKLQEAKLAEEIRRQELFVEEERRRRQAIQAEAMKRQKVKSAEAGFRSGRDSKRDGMVNTAQVYMRAGNQAKVAKVERHGTIKSTVVQIENFDRASVASSASLYSQPSFVSRNHDKVLTPTPVPPVPALPRSHQRRPLTPDSTHTVTSEDSYHRPRARDIPNVFTPASEPLHRRPHVTPVRSSKRQDRTTNMTGTTTTSQISAMNYYTSQSGAKYPSFPRAGVPPVPSVPRHYY